jgi:hypothetical protein
MLAMASMTSDALLRTGMMAAERRD